MPECDHCDHHVSDAFHRNYSIDDELLACRECAPTGRIDDAIRERHPDLREPSEAGTTSPTRAGAIGTEGP